MRAIAPLSSATMRGVTMACADGPLPALKWVAPTDIYVESEYQRVLSERSITMVRKIVANWRWAHIKPVICAIVNGKLYAIDGQHTAIAAATLNIEKIPALVVVVNTVRERAKAFIGQNCDRLNLTAAHVYFASLTAGDEVAVAVDQACRKAGVTIIRSSKGPTPYKVGETLTVGLIHCPLRPCHAEGCCVSDWQARAEVVERENEVLRERVAQLEAELTGRLIASIQFRFTGAEARIFGTLMGREMATKQAIMAALYHDRADDEPEIKIVDVYVCKIRKKIRPFGLDIQTIWGRGYALTAAHKAVVRAMSEEQSATAA